MRATHRADEAVDWPAAFALYERSRVARTARVVLPAHEMGAFTMRLVRNDVWRGRAPDRYDEALEWM